MLLRGMVPRLQLSVPMALAVIYGLFVFPLAVLLYYEIRARNRAARTPKGCRRIGLHDGYSNLHDEADYDASGTIKGCAVAGIRVKALVSYPIKSCRGIEFHSVDFEHSGLAWDRQFCFAEYTTGDDERSGRWDAKTLRDGKFSRMARIRCEVWLPDLKSETYDARLRNVRTGGILMVFYPRDIPSLPVWTRLAVRLGLAEDEDYFYVPLNPPADSADYPLQELRLFGVPTQATQYANQVPAALGRFLSSKKPLALFRVHPAHSRVAVGNAPREEELGFAPRMAFSDQYPLQVQSMGSIRAMAARTRPALAELSVRRFRPNVVLEGAAAFAEDDWTGIRLVHRSEDKEEQVDVHVSCRTVRCRLPNVDPDTGERHLVEPDRTLKATRVVDKGAQGGCLGMMLVPTKPKFTVSVGDEVQVVSTGEHFFRAK